MIFLQTYKRILMMMAIAVITGCASPAEVEETSQHQPSTEQAQSNPAVNDLSAGQAVVVVTSQGKIKVEPTVVAVTDAQGNPDIQATKFYNDPLERFNRTMFGFNHALYEYALIPASKGYHYIAPEVVRDKVGNAFDNIREPLNLLSNFFAGEFDEAGANLGRFVINSTVGILGLFDPATDWFDIDDHKQTIADTLQIHDIGAGPYLVLPVLGPSDTRGAFSTVTEGFLHPVNQIFDVPESYPVRGLDGFDDFSNQSRTYELLYQKAKDPYIYLRNQYIQQQRRDELFQYQYEQPEPE